SFPWPFLFQVVLFEEIPEPVVELPEDRAALGSERGEEEGLSGDVPGGPAVMDHARVWCPCATCSHDGLGLALTGAESAREVAGAAGRGGGTNDGHADGMHEIAHFLGVGTCGGEGAEGTGQAPDRDPHTPVRDLEVAALRHD